MAIGLSQERARRLRWRAQGLTGEPGGNVEGVVQRLVAIQAQEERSARLAVRPRSRGLTAEMVDAARVEDRSTVRAWLLRGTLHLVAVEDFEWLRRLVGPQAVRSAARRRQQLGLDEETYHDAARRLRNLLAVRGPQTRAAIVEQLGENGIDLSGQRAPHLIGRAALEGWVCHGPIIDGVETYVLVDDWLGPVEGEPEGDDALAEIARRYLAGYGPAEPRDLATWAGLSMRDARRGWEMISSELVEVDLAGELNWMLASHQDRLDDPPPGDPLLRLIPAYDPYLLGYRNRDLAVPPDHAREVHPGGGLLRPVVAIDGLAVGTWTFINARRNPRVEISLFDGSSQDEPAGLQAEIDDVIRFLGAEQGG